MEQKLRVLIVDDSVDICRALTRMLPFEVVGTAVSGRTALAMIPQVNPDVVILDILMPEMNGLRTLAALRQRYKTLPVIMFSALSARGASATLDALELGANDYVLKPSNRDSAKHRMRTASEELARKIRLHCVELSGRRKTTLAPAATALAAPVTKGSGRAGLAEIIAIGVSTGGPSALNQVVPLLPANLSVPVLVVQHMPRLFTTILAERLAAKSALPVCEARQGDALVPGRVWIAPGDYHMAVKRADAHVVIDLNQAPPENACRPAVDVLFRSVAAVYGPKALGVVMTGMGHDGLHGCETIHANHGSVIVQDEESSVVWGMPGAVVEAGLADAVVPLKGLAQSILGQVRKPVGDKARAEPPPTP